MIPYLFLAAFSGVAAAQEIRLASRSEPSLPQDAAGGMLGFVAGSLINPISADGRYIAFMSAAAAAVPDQVNTVRARNVFVYDRVTGAVALVSHVPGSVTTTGNAYSGPAAISADGNWVVFASAATDLVPGQINSGATTGVFLYERQTGIVTLVSHAAGSTAALGNGSAGEIDLSISANGSHVVFQSHATDHVAGQLDGNDREDVFLYTRATGQIVLVSHMHGSTVTTADASSGSGKISADGTTVAFVSAGTNLANLQEEGNTGTDVFLFERATGNVTLVTRSVHFPNRTSSRASYDPVISADGRFVAFYGGGGNLVSGVTGSVLGSSQVYVFDRVTQTNQLLTYAANRTDRSANGSSWRPRISQDGQWIAFVNTATDLVPDQVNRNSDWNVYLAERSTGVVALVSRSAEGSTRTGDGSADDVTLSADGRYVAFHSSATDHVAGQTGTASNIFLFDRTTSETRLISHSSRGGIQSGAGGCRLPAITPDGAYVTFDSYASDLAASSGDQNNDLDVWFWEAVSDVTTLVSRNHAAQPSATAAARSLVVNARGAVQEPEVLAGRKWSDDGRYLVFESWASNLLPGQVGGGAPNVFLLDRMHGTVTLVSRREATRSTTANGFSGNASIAADGAYVVFESSATDLVAGVYVGRSPNVYLWERATGAVELVSGQRDSPYGGNQSYHPALSADGAYVAFTSWDWLDPNSTDVNGTPDVYLFERATGRVSLVSRTAAGGVAGDGWSGRPRIDAAGRYVVYLSDVNDLAAGQVDSGERMQVFLFDRVLGTTTLVSRVADTAATESNGYAYGADISEDGRRVVFVSESSDLLPVQPDTARTPDVFVYDTQTSTTTLVSWAADTSQAAGGVYDDAIISGDGSTVLFASFARDLVPGQVDATGADLFLHDLSSASTHLVSRVHGTSATAAGYEMGYPGAHSLSRYGRYVVFVSRSPTLVPSGIDTNTGTDVFLYDRSSGQVTLVSRGLAGEAAGCCIDGNASVSGDGNYVAFSSTAPTLVANDLNDDSDAFLFGPVWKPASDLIFADGVESGDVGAWGVAATDSGDLFVSGAAAMNSSTWGLEGVVDDSQPLHVEDHSPVDERRYRARFYFDPSGFDPGEANGKLRARLFVAFEEAPARRLLTIVLRRQTGSYALMGQVREDDHDKVTTGFVPLTPGPHSVEFDWIASSGPNAGDGAFRMWIDDTPVAELAALDNSLSAVDFVRLGALSLKQGAAGTLYWDEFESRRESYIGP